MVKDMAAKTQEELTKNKIRTVRRIIALCLFALLTKHYIHTINCQANIKIPKVQGYSTSKVEQLWYDMQIKCLYSV